MKDSVLNVTVSVTPFHKTSLAEAGMFDLNLPDGSVVVAIAQCYAFDHDRSLFEHILYPVLSDLKPAAVFALGNMIHRDGFTAFPSRRSPKRVEIHTHPHTPELKAVLDEFEGFEERVLAYGKKCGQFIANLADVGNSHVIYIPSHSPMIPNEWDIVKFVYYAKAQIDAWTEKHRPKEEPEDPIELPASSEEFAELLSLDKDNRVSVLPFGAAVYANQDTLFLVGDFRRRNPLTAAYVELEQRQLNIVRGGYGKLSSGWFTTRKASLLRQRRYHQHHEVGNLMDSQRMGKIRDYDRMAKGFYVGTVVRGKIVGCSIPILFGADGRRCVVVNGKGYQEPLASGFGRRGIITLPERS